jgi:alpha-amylase
MGNIPARGPLVSNAITEPSPSSVSSTDADSATNLAGRPRAQPANPVTSKTSGDPFEVNYDSIMLQGFHWTSCEGGTDGRSWYAELLASIPDIKATGVDVIWLPPPSHSVAPQGYLPQRLYGRAAGHPFSRLSNC